MGCSSMETLGTLVPITMWSFYDILVYIDISVNISPIGMNILIFFEKSELYRWRDVYYVQDRVPNANHATMQPYNKMHASFRVQVKWGIGGLKRKWRCFIAKKFDSTKQKYSHLFQAIVS